MFFDRLQATVTLTLGQSTATITAGNLKRFELVLSPWGFTGLAEWWIICVSSASEDTLFQSFTGDAPASVKLSLARAFSEITRQQEQQATALLLSGLVVERRVLERSFEAIEGQPVLHRRYTIRFADRGAALWSQHRPSVLYVGKTLQQLIDANLPEGVTVEHSWAASSTTYPVLALGLGAAEDGASYQDFLFWLCDKLNVGFSYDIAGDKYTIADDKPGAATVSLRPAEVESLECVFPEVPRDAVAVLNAYSDAATARTDIANDQGITGVQTHYLIRSPISGDMDARVTLETARAKRHAPEARGELKIFPATPPVPGLLVKLDDTWSANLYQHGKTYRVVSVRLAGEAADPQATADNGETTNRYRLHYELHLELDSDPVVRLPAYRRPLWPFFVEGKVLSETGDESELTFQPYTDDATSLDSYKVKIPLWGDQQVIVPYEPLMQPGHFFFPLYRDERVLVALYFDKARIRAFLDWRPGARMPTDAQGDHLLLGKKDTSQTSISHAYTDQKPVLTIKRTQDEDVQTLTVSEGMIRWETRDH